jgi:hypothetical protein
MDIEKLHARPPIDRFAWEYSFYAYLVYREAPLSESQLADLAQALHVIKGHLNPIAAADEVLLTWPFDVTDYDTGS